MDASAARAVPMERLMRIAWPAALILFLAPAVLAPVVRAGETGHEHQAPHGGALIELGEEFAHVELVCEPASGALRLYVLDGEAQRGVRIAQSEVILRIASAQPQRAAPLELRLAPVENALTGETAGDTSEFGGRDDRLVGVRAFRGELVQLGVRGRRFEGVPVDYPDAGHGRRGS
jgi:hypothetical protein